MRVGRVTAQGAERTVTVISMGPPQVDVALREAITLGADEAILLSDARFAGADTWATSFALAAATANNRRGSRFLRDAGHRRRYRADRPGITVHADYGLATYVSKIEEIDEKRAKVRRLLEEGYELCAVNLPALFTVVKEINEPRTPSMRGKMRAKSAANPGVDGGEHGPRRGKMRAARQPTQVVKIFSPEHRAGGERWEGEAELAEKLCALLCERVIISAPARTEPG